MASDRLRKNGYVESMTAKVRTALPCIVPRLVLRPQAIAAQPIGMTVACMALTVEMGLGHRNLTPRAIEGLLRRYLLDHPELYWVNKHDEWLPVSPRCGRLDRERQVRAWLIGGVARKLITQHICGADCLVSEIAAELELANE